MRENAWLSVPADANLLFDLPLEQRWASAVSALGVDISYLHGVGGHA
jgi:putative transcriptional regulator